MKRFLVLGLVLTASLVGQVEHAPTVAQCQADRRLWLAKIEEGDSPKLPTFNVLTKWVSEMDDCQKVDPDNVGKYVTATSEIDVFQATRLANFLTRHDMWQKFLDEDAAGQR
jgi:hypothetical protein